jgi:hypothetical protein
MMDGSAKSRSWLLLGARPDGSLYGRDELEALDAVFPALRDSLNSAIMRETYREQQHRADRLVRRDIAELRSRLALIESGTRADRRAEQALFVAEQLVGSGDR